MKRTARLPAALVLLLAGCRTVGPELSPPEMNVPAAFKHAGPPSAPEDIARSAGEPWWTVFADSTLDQLETAALAQSPTLAAAVARVDEARARLGFARGDTRVAVNANGTARFAGESAERELPVPGGPLRYRERGNSYRIGFEAGFELDLWGRVKRSLQSADAQITASEADQRAVRLVLTADVAQAYFVARSLEDVVDVLSRTAASRREAIEVLGVRFNAGLSGELDLERTRVEFANVEAELADSVRRRDQAVNALAILTGVTPAMLPWNAAGSIAGTPPSIPAGLPSGLLLRRPDLAASAAQLRARTAEIGVAEAARFPTIRLTGGAGFESVELGHLLERPAQFWQIGPSVSVPLFDGGRARASVAAAEARTQVAVADYRQRALVAFREVEDALVDLRQQSEQAAAQARAAGSAQTVIQLATVRYERGFATYLDVIDAQRSLLQIERSRAELAGARRASTVRLIRALGGGWN